VIAHVLGIPIEEVILQLALAGPAAAAVAMAGRARLRRLWNRTGKQRRMSSAMPLSTCTHAADAASAAREAR
jgi:hypothetical protein